MDAGQLQRQEAEASRLVEEDAEFAENSPFPDGSGVLEGVFASW